MMKHLDYCTHIQFKDDVDILTRPNFNVNIRLLQINMDYRNVIQNICDYIILCASTSKEGYAIPHGWSGANAGIPFNIIAFMNDDKCHCWINPKIIKWSGHSREVQTNCGSLTLPQSVLEYRDNKIDVEFYNIRGDRLEWRNIGPKPGYTIQHEIAHTRGILLRNR